MSRPFVVFLNILLLGRLTQCGYVRYPDEPILPLQVIQGGPLCYKCQALPYQVQVPLTPPTPTCGQQFGVRVEIPQPCCNKPQCLNVGYDLEMPITPCAPTFPNLPVSLTVPLPQPKPCLPACHGTFEVETPSTPCSPRLTNLKTQVDRVVLPCPCPAPIVEGYVSDYQTQPGRSKRSADWQDFDSDCDCDCDENSDDEDDYVDDEDSSRRLWNGNRRRYQYAGHPSVDRRTEHFCTSSLCRNSRSDGQINRVDKSDIRNMEERAYDDNDDDYDDEPVTDRPRRRKPVQNEQRVFSRSMDATGNTDYYQQDRPYQKQKVSSAPVWFRKNHPDFVQADALNGGPARGGTMIDSLLSTVRINPQQQGGRIQSSRIGNEPEDNRMLIDSLLSRRESTPRGNGEGVRMQSSRSQQLGRRPQGNDRGLQPGIAGQDGRMGRNRITINENFPQQQKAITNRQGNPQDQDGITTPNTYGPGGRQNRVTTPSTAGSEGSQDQDRITTPNIDRPGGGQNRTTTASTNRSGGTQEQDKITTPDTYRSGGRQNGGSTTSTKRSHWSHEQDRATMPSTDISDGGQNEATITNTNRLGGPQDQDKITTSDAYGSGSSQSQDGALQNQRGYQIRRGLQGSQRQGGTQGTQRQGGTQGAQRQSGTQETQREGRTQGAKRPGGFQRAQRQGGTQGAQRQSGTQETQRGGGTQGVQRQGGTQGAQRQGGTQGAQRQGGNQGPPRQSAAQYQQQRDLPQKPVPQSRLSILHSGKFNGVPYERCNLCDEMMRIPATQSVLFGTPEETIPLNDYIDYPLDTGEPIPMMMPQNLRLSPQSSVITPLPLSPRQNMVLPQNSPPKQVQFAGQPIQPTLVDDSERIVSPTTYDEDPTITDPQYYDYDYYS